MLLAKRHQLIALCPIPLAGGTPRIDKSMALSQVFEVFGTIGGILIGREGEEGMNVLWPLVTLTWSM